MAACVTCDCVALTASCCLSQVSEDLLRLVVNEAQKTEGIHHDEGKMITGVLDLHSVSVSKIMQPRIDIVAVSADASIAEILQTATVSRYSRIPVYRGDSVDNIVGVIICKDLLNYVKNNNNMMGSTDSVSSDAASGDMDTDAEDSSRAQDEVSKPLSFFSDADVDDPELGRLERTIGVDSLDGFGDSDIDISKLQVLIFMCMAACKSYVKYTLRSR
jgi:predicted transcriptional regulator